MKYSKQDFIDALRAAGVERGDLIMVHTGMSSLRAMPEGVNSQEELSAFCAECLLEVIGDEGTLCVPAFSYTLGRGDVFDPATTPSQGLGEFSEYFRRRPDVVRSDDPFLSMAACGARAQELLKERAQTSYGYGSFFDTFTQAGGKLVTIGVGLRWTTILSYFIEIADAPFRYQKVFEGKRRVNGIVEPVTWEYSVAPWSDKTARQIFFIVQDELIRLGIAKRAAVGRGFINCVGVREYGEYVLNALAQDPWFAGGEIHSVEQIIDEEYQRTGRASFDITLDGTDIDELAQKLTPLPRYPISDGYDATLNALQSKFPLTVENVLTGTRLNGWVVPERWLCRSAALKTVGDEILLDLKTDPLMVASNSRSIKALVDRAELLRHIYTPSTDSNAVPYVERDVQRTWGLCCSRDQFDELSEEVYKVEIDADFSFGQAKIGEWVLDGQSNDTLLLLTYLDSPYQFNAGLSGVIAGLKMMERLSDRQRHFTYRLLILPRQLGLTGWVALHPDLMSKVIGGIALEGLSIADGELTLYKSTAEDTLLDRLTEDFAVQNIVRVRRMERSPDGITRRFLGLDYDLPMLTLMRRASGGRIDQPCDDWRTSADTWQAADATNLERSIEWLDGFINRLECLRGV